MFYYSSEKNTQILVAMLKAKGIKYLVASPGSASMNFVASCQYDGSFIMYSAVDERGAAYMACGLASELNEPVILVCTESTASRDYYPGLTEAYHRKLPILVITCSADINNKGHLFPQWIDQSVHPKDTLVASYSLQKIKDQDDEWDCSIKINRAFADLSRNGGGPVHLLLTTGFSSSFDCTQLPPVRLIDVYDCTSPNLPEIKKGSRIAITIGNHHKWRPEDVKSIEQFCEAYDSVVFCDFSSNYYGKYAIKAALVGGQQQYDSPIFDIDILIQLGEQVADRFTCNRFVKVKEVWRVSPDGEIRDTYKKLKTVFCMQEGMFFNKYNSNGKTDLAYYKKCVNEIEKFRSLIPEIPFSNAWIASKLSGMLSKSSNVFFGGSNTIRVWSLFELDQSIGAGANMGSRGIDGVLSTAIGTSLVDKNRIQYCILGDLSFFYDLNSLGNREITKNLRILLINNGEGTLFRTYDHPAQRAFGDDTSLYVSAKGHFGCQSRTLVYNYSENLGFEYLTADSKETFEKMANRFVRKGSDKPIVFEVFTNIDDESAALYMLRNLKVDSSHKMKNIVKSALGEKGINMAKSVLGK